MPHSMLRVVALIIVASLMRPNLTAAQSRPANTKPNVLLIIADDLRTELGCYGVERIYSPNIDQLASRGVRFERAYCQYPVCNPSRTSFLTGLRPDNTKVLGNTQQFRKTLPDVVTLPQHLRQHGYFTASLGKVFHRGGSMEDVKAEMDDPASWDVARYFAATPTGNTGEGRDLTGGKLKWCRWLSANGNDEDQPDGQIARDAIRLLNEHRDGPFFLAVGFHKPHDPFIAPKKYFDLYPLEKIALPTIPPDQTPAPDLAIGGGEFGRVFDQFNEQDKREFTRAYLAGVSFMDVQVGRVLDALDSRSLTQNTIVIFLGDHGYHLGERNWWNKNTLFEYSARAPLIVASPGVKSAGRSCGRLVEFVDLYPTVLDLCGLDVPKQKLAGTSLRPLLDDPNAKWDKPAFTQVRRGEVMGRSVRTERWRYTEWDQGRRGRELYDHDKDPLEDHNVAEDAAKQPVIAELKALLPP